MDIKKFEGREREVRIVLTNMDDLVLGRHFGYDFGSWLIDYHCKN